MLATGMRAGQKKLVAQAIEQARPRLDIHGVLLPVDVELDFHVRPIAAR